MYGQDNHNQKERKMKNILIIGGSYFAGKVLVEELIREKEYNIFVFNRGNVPLKWPKVTELVGDREKEADIKNAIPDKEWFAVVDFCAYTPDHIEKILRCLPGTFNHYIFISTTTVNTNSLDLPIRENALKLSGPQPEMGPYADYGYNKWLAERLLEAECKKKHANYTSLRPAVIYGEYNYAPRESYFFDLIAEKKPVVIPENGLALFSFVWVVDLARIIIKCLGNKNVFNEAFNISAEELVSYPRLVEVFKEISGKDFETVKMGIDEINQKRIPLPFPLDDHLIYSGRKIQKILDFDYTPFIKGMHSTYNYYQKVLEARKKLTEEGNIGLNNQEKIAADYDREGKEALQISDYKKAHELFEKARQICRKQGDKANEAFQNFNIAHCYQNTNMPNEAIKAYEVSYNLIKDDPVLAKQQAMALNNMGHLCVSIKQFEQALNCFKKAGNLLETIKDVFGHALQLQNIGSVYRDSLSSEKALQAYHSAIALFEQIGDKMLTADQCTNIAYIHSVDENTVDALKWYKKALELYKELNNESKATLTKQNIDALKIQL